VPRLLIAKARLPFPIEAGTDAVTYGIVDALRNAWDITILSADDRIRARVGAEALRQKGIDVVLVPAHRSIIERSPLRGKAWANAARLIASVPRSYWTDAWPALTTALPELTRGEAFDLVQLEYWSLGRYARFADAPVALLNHDVWFRTAEHLASRAPTARQRLVWSLEARATRRWELRAQMDAEWRLYLTDADRSSADRQMDPVSPSAVVPMAFPYPPLARSSGEGMPPRVVFVGALGALFNQDAARLLVTQLWPAVRTRVRDAELVIAGGGAPSWLTACSGHAGIEVPGFVDDLQALMGRSRLAVVPTRIGTGIKTKVALALSCGVPVVGSASAVVGYPDTEGIVQADAGDTMVDSIVRLLSDPVERSHRARAALECYVSDLWVESTRARVRTFYDRLLSGTPL
jgi:glycosyltransferase involved in cell wall biosynthesis